MCFQWDLSKARSHHSQSNSAETWDHRNTMFCWFMAATVSLVLKIWLQAKLFLIFSSWTTLTNALCMFTAMLSNIMLQLKSIKQPVHISVQPGSIFSGTSTYIHIKPLLILIHKVQTHYPDTLQVASWAKINRVNLGWSRALINSVLSSELPRLMLYVLHQTGAFPFYICS